MKSIVTLLFVLLLGLPVAAQQPPAPKAPSAAQDLSLIHI